MNADKALGAVVAGLCSIAAERWANDDIDRRRTTPQRSSPCHRRRLLPRDREHERPMKETSALASLHEHFTIISTETRAHTFTDDASSTRPDDALFVKLFMGKCYRRPVPVNVKGSGGVCRAESA